MTTALTKQDYWIIYIAVVTATLPAVLPVAVSVFANELNFGVERAGYIASANMASILVGVLACYFLVARYSQRALLLAGLVVMSAGHLMTAGSELFSHVLVTRIFSGLGEGIAASVCYRAIGESRQPARAFALYASGQAIVGAVGMGISGVLIRLWGWESLFVVLCIIAIPAIGAANRVGNRALPGIASTSRRPLFGGPWLVWAKCLGIFLFFVGLGGLFAFFAVIGEVQGHQTSAILSALAIASLFGLAGSMAAAMMAGRIRGHTAILAGALLLGVAILALSLLENPLIFASAASVIMFGWYWTYPYMFQNLAGTENCGRVLNLVPAITGAGLALGPLVAGFCIQHGMAIFAAMVLACLSASTVLILGFQETPKPVGTVST